MFWLTQCFVFTKLCASILQSSSLNWSLKLVILWLWSRLQPLLNQINFRGGLTSYFHYFLVSPPCFQLGAYCLGEQVMGPKKKTRHFLWFVQNPTLKGKLKECLCRKKYNRFVRMLDYMSTRLAGSEIRKDSLYWRGVGVDSEESLPGTLREGACNHKHVRMEENHSWGVIRSQGWNGYLLYQHKFARGNYTVFLCARWGRSSRLFLSCSGNAWKLVET